MHSGVASPRYGDRLAVSTTHQTRDVAEAKTLIQTLHIRKKEKN
jgi:hypothetical protein